MRVLFSLALATCLLCVGCTIVPDPVLPAPQSAAQAVVFDIDGTLTPDVHNVFKVRAHAAEAVRLYADKGYHVIYLSARVRPLQFNIRDWLEKHAFPDGSVHVTETSAHRSDHALFKTEILNLYNEQGWDLVYAYGDSATDFEAYANAGIASNRVFALQRKGDDSCKEGGWKSCLNGWTEHLEFIKTGVPAIEAPADF